MDFVQTSQFHPLIHTYQLGTRNFFETGLLAKVCQSRSLPLSLSAPLFMGLKLRLSLPSYSPSPTYLSLFDLSQRHNACYVDT